MTENKSGAPRPMLTWEAPEFIHHPKGFGWQVTVWLAALGVGGLFLFLNGLNFTGIVAAVVALAAALALTTQGHVKPKQIRLSLTENGLIVGTLQYPWSDLKSFWIVYTPLSQTLYFETTRRILPILTIQLGKTNPDAVRALLLRHLPEHEGAGEDFADRLSRMIKF